MTVNVKTFEDGTQVIDTKNIQLFSLIAVMQEFGYWFNESVCNFYNPENENEVVSFKSAVELHNVLDDLIDDIYWCSEDGHYSFNHFNFTLYDYHRACGAQVIKKVKLQLNKKTKHIFAQSDKISFVIKSYQHLFLPK